MGITKLARNATSILLLGVLLFVYANLPEQVGLLFDRVGNATYALEKGTFFYLTIGLVLLLNFISTLFTTLMSRVPVSSERFFFLNDRFKENFLVWLGSLSSVMNLFFIFVVAFIGIYNNGDPQLIASYGYLAYLGQFLVLAWVISIVVIILKRID